MKEAVHASQARSRRLALAMVLMFAATAISTAVAESAFAPRSSFERSADCLPLDSCEACTASPACGWCDLADAPPDETSKAYRNSNRFAGSRGMLTGTCLQGTPNGPESDTCTGLWKYGSCVDEEECDSRKTCADCIDPELPEGCGWCDTRCVGGTALGPLNTQVACVDFLYPPETCQDVDCSLFTDCNLCSGQPLCGWCSNTTVAGEQGCFKGNEDGTQEPGICSVDAWFPTSGECIDEPDPCRYTNCAECIGAASENCSWCKTAGKCLVIGSDDEERCTEVLETSCDEACENFEFCNNCVADVACGWCTSSAGEYCVNGDATGPALNVSCEAFDYDTCPSCEALSASCDDCFTNLNCEWCFVNQSGQVQPKCLDVGSSVEDKVCLNSTLECATSLPSPTASPTPSASKSSTATPTATATLPGKSASPVKTPSQTLTATPTETFAPPTNTTTATPTPTLSKSASNTTTSTPSVTPSETPTKSAVPSPTKSPLPTLTSTASETATASPSFTSTATASMTATATATHSTAASDSPTASPTKTATVSPSFTSTPTESFSSTPTPAGGQPSATPSATPSPSPTNSALKWAVLGPLIAITVIVAIAIVLVVAYLFYTKYWKKRWYYMKLK